jgi:hypothetical protein
MSRIDINSKIMYGSTGSENSLDEVSGSEPALVLYDPHTFGASCGMFNPHSERGDLLIVFLFFLSKLSTLWLFYRLESNQSGNYCYVNHQMTDINVSI